MPYKTFLSFLTSLSDTGIPSRIDRSVMGTMSGGAAYGMLSALKFLRLIDANGMPSDLFIKIVKADEGERQNLVEIVIRSAFPEFFVGTIDLSTATSGQFDQLMRDLYDVKGATLDRCANFFLASVQDAGLVISPHLKGRKPTSSTSAGRKARKSKASDSNTKNSEITRPRRNESTEAPLEYRLVDLLSKAVEEPDVMEAIWTVVKFLKLHPNIEIPTDDGQPD